MYWLGYTIMMYSDGTEMLLHIDVLLIPVR